jgi:hypothetical protein
MQRAITIDTETKKINIETTWEELLNIAKQEN